MELGEWQETVGRAQVAEAIWAGCPGTAFEMATTRLFELSGLFFIGELRDLSQRVDRWLPEALDRGDVYAAASMRLDIPDICVLNREGPEEVRHAMADMLQRLSVTGYKVQHYWAMLSETHILLYEQDGPGALERVQRDWQVTARSLLNMIHDVHDHQHRLRAAAALATALHATTARAAGLRPCNTRPTPRACKYGTLCLITHP